MTILDERKTWDDFVAAMKQEFRGLLGQNTPDCWYEFRFNYECPTPCDSLDYSYPMALVRIELKGKAWWNFWKGSRCVKTLFEVREDWGRGFLTNVSESWREQILPALTQIEQRLGVTFCVRVC